ncbi:hypothetical protein [Pseudomonas sp. 25 E 4]|uniref:hypothetical protein n=1 Tax=Pseudomonas sp. 25 E 4 TaxID=1844097 RepID=UPI00081C0296|nr:hypothetical protein [Pseudomonas sp. 25 E 4]
MGWLEFIEKAISHLVWPIIALTFITVFRKPVADLIPRLKSAKLLGLEAVLADLPPKLVEHLDVKKLGAESPAARVISSYSNERFGFKLYSNGLMVQRLTLALQPGQTSAELLFPVAMINEPTSIQVLGVVNVNVESWRQGSCKITFPLSSDIRSVELVITGV